MKKNKRIIIFGSFLKNYSHNQQLLRYLKKNYEINFLDIEYNAKISPFNLVIYIFKKIKIFKKIPNNCIVIVGFNSVYDCFLLKLMSYLQFKRIILINDFLISQYDTYAFNKIIHNKLTNFLFIPFCYMVDFLNLQFSDIIIFDTNFTRDRFVKTFCLYFKEKHVIPISANNNFFFHKKEKSFFQKKKIDIVWYGNPSKLHNIDLINNVLNKLNKTRFNVNIISGNIMSYSIESISNILKKSHIAIGCFSITKKCQDVVLNKEYEALASHCLLITSEGKEKHDILSNTLLLPHNEDLITNELNQLFFNRSKLFEISRKGFNKYSLLCNDTVLSDSYSKIIDKIYV